MDRKHKKRHSERRSDAEFFPPCRVCEGPGNGIHYGVNTCDACKGFFHRSLRLHPQYKCSGDGNCLIRHGTGKMCQLCRYCKCLAAGLSRGAIRKGRYTSETKTDFILRAKQRQKEQKKQEQKSSDSQSNVAQFDSRIHQILEENIVTSSTLSQDELRVGHQLSPESIQPSAFRQSSFSSHPEVHHTTITANANANATAATTTTNNNNSYSYSPLPSYSYASATIPSPGEFSGTSSDSQLSFSMCHCHGPAPNPHQNHAHSSPSDLTTSSGDSTSINYYHYYNLDLPSPKSVDSAASSSPCCPLTESSSPDKPPRLLRFEPRREDVPENRDGQSSEDFGFLDEAFSNKDVLIDKLVKAHAVALTGQDWTPEEARRESRQHYEACKLRAEMFGQLALLPDEEFETIYEETGLDADGRLLHLNHFSTGLEMCIRRMVQFARAIPGFAALEMDEKIDQVKYNRIEFSWLCNSKFTNSELNVVRCMSDRWLCLLECYEKHSFDTLKQYIHLCGKLNSLELSKEEHVVLTAVTSMSASRVELKNSPLLQHIQWRLTQLLIYCLEKRRKRPQLVFAKIMDILLHFQNNEKDMKLVVRNLRLHKYKKLRENPFLKEMVKDFYFKAEELN